MHALQRLKNSEWPTATPHNRYRLLTALASANVVLGHTAQAIVGYREAYACAPDFPVARATLATAQLMDNEPTTAFATASQALQEDPSCEQAALILIQATPSTIDTSELRAMLPAPLLEKPLVLVALAWLLRERKDEAEAQRVAEAAYGRDPNNWQACTLLGELLLSPIFDDETLLLTKAVPPACAEDFERSLRLLHSAWSKVREGDHARNALYVAGNLANALEVAGRGTDAELVVEQALQVDSTFAPALRRRAVTLALADDWQGAATAMGRIPRDEQDDQDSILLGQAKLALGETTEARQIAERVLRSTLPGRIHQSAVALVLDIALASGATSSDIASACDAEPDSMLVRTIAVRFKPMNEVLQNRLIDDVRRIVGSNDDARNRVMGADILAELGQHSAAADLLASVTNTATDTLPLQRRLKALLLGDRRREARTLFEALPLRIREKKLYIEIGVMIYEQVGMLPRARLLLESYCAQHSGDLNAKLAWLGLCQRLGDLATVQGWLQEVSPAITGSPYELMTLAHAIDRHTGDPKCLNLGYRALREGYADPKMHLAYMGGLVFFGTTLRTLRDEPETVGIDTAVTLKEVDGSRTLVRIIESEPNPNIERFEIAADDPLAARLLGLHVGDTITFHAAGSIPIEFSVTLIQTKFVYAHFRALAEFERLFPENRAFGSMTIDTSQGADGIKALLQVVRRRGEYIRELEEQYHTGATPVAFVAVAGGASVFDVWDAFAANPKIQLHVAAGSAEDFSMAATRVACAKLAILDPLTVYTASRLGMDNGLRMTIPRLGVTQTTRDLLKELIEDRKRDADSEGHRGTMAWTGEHYVMHKQTADEARLLVERAEAALAFAEACELVSADGDLSVIDELQGLWKMLPGAFLDSVLAAQGQDAILIIDDAILRTIIEVSTGVTATWSQPILQYGLHKGRVTAKHYTDAVLKLVDARCQFTMFGSMELTQALIKEDWNVRGLVLTLVDLIARPTNDPDTVAGVLEEFARKAWHFTRGDDRFDRSFTAIFKAMKVADRPWAEAILSETLSRMRQGFQLRSLRKKRRKWLVSTSLVEVTSLTFRVFGVASIVGTRIVCALERNFSRP